MLMSNVTAAEVDSFACVFKGRLKKVLTRLGIGAVTGAHGGSGALRYGASLVDGIHLGG